jgi:hypothetical protein
MNAYAYLFEASVMKNIQIMFIIKVLKLLFFSINACNSICP